MCTLVILRQPGARWPLMLGANRDEMLSRPWRAPARHWPDRPEVVAGLDETAGGSWLGLNDHGLVAAMLNRVNSLGPADGKRSRGELVLEALDHAEAGEAARALAALEPSSYRSFNLFVGDALEAFWLRNEPEGAGIEVFAVPEGLSLLTAHDLNDTTSERVRLYLPRFRAANLPDPEADDWSGWSALLASGERLPGAAPRGAMCIETATGFGTGSSSLLALPEAGAVAAEGLEPRWLFAAGPPDRTSYRPVEFAPPRDAAAIQR